MSALNKLAVFASGTGSNFEAIEKAIREGQVNAEIALVVSDKPEAKVIDKAKSAGIPTFVFDPKGYSSKQVFEQEIVEALHKEKVDWIILAGYMRLVGDTLLTPYEGRIINIHPSLLPAFKGLDAVGQAFDAGVKVTGVTIHFVDKGMDTGRIIAQEAVYVKDGMSKPDLEYEIQKVEHLLYPNTIQQLINRGNQA
ncbi:formyltetrahydrofolate-dependent phosphoribosylglycinamide formyltransferase [Pelagirhabdus alkalitolerans]|uniref:Phosphoribosylglycinamide formyltransferase n=1 Tax=Pelagirhabdus alkalitolerans TaxID=1612202 RepID=A0A1G6ITU8_9BACI|nr:phosphoribosylglycinamide formyltransferase [Pelagirhabdus alkalitolerans]SDC09919.1 formyltetrahydrofolate-dependent phosphoribosylglycinamide formyltransferase [Pelagirhabdus alkalitolerans]